MKTKIASFVLFVGAAAALNAAPVLRLTQSAFGPILVAQGSNGRTQIADAYNIGSGSLTLTLTASDAWLVPTLGATTPCEGSSACTPIQIVLQTSALAAGTYTGTVTVSSANAEDSPQTITVTVDVGGNVPSQITLYAAPGGTASTTFNTTASAAVSATTSTGGSWLSVVSSGNGSFNFAIPYTVNVNATNLSATTYNGTITVAGSSLAADNKSIPVTLNVTTQPIAQPTSSTVQFNIAQGAMSQTFPVVLNNAGQGTLTVSSATVSSGASWLTAAAGANNVITLTANPTGLSPGKYPATLTIASNAVNGPTTIPVQLTVAATAAPQITYGGAVDVFTNSVDDFISQGDVLAIYGSQFISGAAQQAMLPLPTTLGGVQVLLNGTAIPVEYVSASQINVQIPYDAQLGAGTLQVVSNSQNSNTISVNILAAAPAILGFSGTNYVVAQTAAGGYEGYPAAGFAAAHAGDTLVLYAVGLGQTSPAATAGMASPGAGMLASVTPTPLICFGDLNPIAGTANCVKPFFAGLTPGYFGLYQLNFTLPNGVPTGNAVPISVIVGNSTSNSLSIAIQ